jgi:hypothetical protein
MIRTRNSIPLIAAVATFVIHAVSNPHYGFFRDELYFIICGRHPAWGYVDQPPVAPLLAAASQLFGDSLFLLRLVPALFAAAGVFVTCALAVELGGGAFAQMLAAIVALSTPVLMSFGMKVSPDTIGLWLWPLAALFVLRIVKGESQRLWLAVGAVFGIGLQSKYSVAYFIVALLVGLLLTPQRRVMWSKWFAGGVALAVVIALPNFLWQAAHGFPMLELLRNGLNGKNVIVGPAEFIGQQFLITNPFLSLVWLVGLVWLLLRPAARFLGLTYVALMAAMIASHAKHYYPADVYPILIAGGGVAIEEWTARLKALRPLVATVALVAGLVFVPFALPILSEPGFIAYSDALSHALHVSEESTKTEHQQLGALPQDWADMHGWPEFAQTVARVYDSLPPADRADAVAFAQNYGEAAAIEFFEPRVPVVSGHNQYWLWGPRGHDGNVVIDIDGDCGAKKHLFRSAEKAATFTAPYIMPYEDHMPLMVCRGIREPLSTLWPGLKHYE